MSCWSVKIEPIPGVDNTSSSPNYDNSGDEENKSNCSDALASTGQQQTCVGIDITATLITNSGKNAEAPLTLLDVAGIGCLNQFTMMPSTTTMTTTLDWRAHITDLNLKGGLYNLPPPSNIMTPSKRSTSSSSPSSSSSSEEEQPTDVVSTYLMRILATHPSLCCLNLSENGMTDRHAVILAKALKSKTTCLKVLDLGRNRISDDGVTAISNALQYHNETLEVLTLHCNDIQSECCPALAKALQKNVTLKKLDLGYNMVGAKGAICIAAGVAMCKTRSSLHELDLSSNAIGDEGCVAIASALKYNRSLTNLYLNDNGIGDEGCRSIGGALRHNTTLRVLDCYHNIDITGIGESLLAAAMDANYTIEWIGISRLDGDGEMLLDIQRSVRGRFNRFCNVVATKMPVQINNIGDHINLSYRGLFNGGSSNSSTKDSHSNENKPTAGNNKAARALKERAAITAKTGATTSSKPNKSKTTTKKTHLLGLKKQPVQNIMAGQQRQAKE